MEICQLESFASIVSTGSFSAASRTLHLSQPSVSNQIKKLELELGHELFTRSRLGVELSEFGSLIHPLVRELLRTRDEIHSIANAVGAPSRTISLWTTQGCELSWLTSAMGLFQQANPGIKFHLLEGGSREIINSVQNESIDLGIAGHTGPLEAPLEHLVVHEDPLCVYFNSDYFTGISESLKIEDLLRFPLITLAEGSGSRGALESAIRESGILSKNHCVDPAIACSSPLRAIQLADAGEGVAVLTPCMIPSSSQNSYVTIAETSVKSFMSVVWNSQKRYLNSCDDFISLVSSEKITKQFSCTSVKRLKNERFSR